MKTLHIVNAKIWGGGEQYVYNLCREEQQLGNENIIVADSAYEDIANRLTAVAKVETVPLTGLKKYLSIPKIIEIAKRERVDVIACHSGSTLAMCALIKQNCKSVRLFVFRHNVLPNKKDAYHKWMYAQADIFICVSRSVYDVQVESAPLKERDKFKLVYTGIDTDKFEERPVVPRDSSTFIVGYAGRIIENKGVLVLLQAIARLREQGVPATLHICGPKVESFEPLYYKTIEELKLQDYVQDFGILSEMNAFYHSLDVFVAPSIVKEAFGLSLVEAMCAGCAVIGTDSGAQSSIISSMKNGILVEPNHVDALVEALLTLYRDPELVSTFGQEGRATVLRDFSLQRMVREINALYDGEQLAEKGAPVLAAGQSEGIGMSLAVAIIAKNEEENMVELIANAKKLTDEIIVVDSHSTDKTVELAESLGAKVFVRDWDDFSGQRNYAMECTDADWILFVDADERLTDELIASIQQTVASGREGVYEFVRYNSAFGKQLSRGGHNADYVKRLFPNKKAHWVGKVHERPESNLPLIRINGVMEHITYRSWEQYFEKFNMYTTLAAENYASRGKKCHFFKDIVFRPGWAFFNHYIVKGGFLNGKVGFLLSICHYFYTVMKYAKLYELNRRKKA